MSPSQLQAQRAITATLVIDIEGAFPDSKIAAGSSVTLQWRRSFLVNEPNGDTVMHHEFSVYAFNIKNRYVEAMVDSRHLRDVVYLNEQISGIVKKTRKALDGVIETI